MVVILDVFSTGEIAKCTTTETNGSGLTDAGSTNEELASDTSMCYVKLASTSTTKGETPEEGDSVHDPRE